jgi:hypothetical protein
MDINSMGSSVGDGQESESCFNKKCVFTLFKTILIVVNALALLTIISGLIYMVYLNHQQGGDHVPEEMPRPGDSPQKRMAQLLDSIRSSNWLWVLLFGIFLMVIPSVGLIGAIAENLCFMTTYGILMSVQTLATLHLRNMWAFGVGVTVSGCAFGLATLINSKSMRANTLI